ncbi:uncharacterized protein LOC134834536 [Culicoides brevitarsis]|uniref:uncharacterized protein LOC134834536 n=1 Tax=Culicoides brevitarsis TaxID=469753 RepID=UPI00307B9D7D
MLQIDNLPPEVLLEIFEHLEPQSRLLASTVCRKWLQLLRKSTFDADRQLYVNEKLLKNQDTCQFLVKNSRLKYKKVRLDSVKSVDEHPDLWSHLGKDVHSAQIRSTGLVKDDKKDFLKDFPELRELKLISNANWKTFYQFNTELSQLRKLSVILDRYQGPLDALKAFLEKNQTLNELQIKSNSMNNQDLVNLIKENAQKVTKLGISLSNNDIQTLLTDQCPFERLRKLSLTLPEAQNEAKIHSVLMIFPKITNLELKLDGFIPVSGFKNLKSLEIENFSYDARQLKALAAQKSLQKLIINYNSSADGSCFFIHERLDNPNLTFLHIYQKNLDPCMVCMSNLCESYPKLQDFKTNLPFLNRHLQVMTRNCLNLRHLRLKFGPTEDSEVLETQFSPEMHSLSLNSFRINENCLLKWKEMTKLTSLNVNLDDDCTEESFRKFMKNFPVLEKVSFVSRATDEMIFAAIDECKRLKNIATCCSKSSKVTEEGLKYVLKHGKAIRKVEFHSIKNVSLEELKAVKNGDNTIAVFTAGSVNYL